jgi:RNA polymerase sigma-70 factor (ECF subfamily)
MRSYERAGGKQENRSKDSVLVDRYIQEGDAHAFGEIVQKYEERIFVFLCRKLSKEDAEDVLATMWQKAAIKLGQFRCESNLLTWLYRIAININNTNLRKKKLHEVLWGEENDLGELSERTIHHESPDTRIIAAETKIQVRKTLKLMEPKEADIIRLYHFEEKTYDEIADLRDIPVGTVRSRLHRARSRFKGLFERRYQNTWTE